MMNCSLKLSFFLLTLVCVACERTSPMIQVACEENAVGNSIIRWEIAPSIQGQVKVYASTSPTQIPEERPIAAAKIDEGKLTIITDDPTKRYYYCAVFNEKYRVKVATRNINVSGVQNVRDLGGYHSNINGKTTRWGKIYRSAKIDTLCPYAAKEFSEIGIKTIIDLCTPAEKGQTIVCNKFNIVNIPIDVKQIHAAIEEVKKGQINIDSLTELMNRDNQKVILNRQKELKQVFDVLLDESNYPLIISCTTGKGRTGLVSALLLSILEMDDDTQLKDYLNSNLYYDITKASEYGFELPVKAQEALTTLYTARESYFYSLKEEIDHTHINFNNYIHKKIGLTTKDVEKLRKMLLE